MHRMFAVVSELGHRSERSEYQLGGYSASLQRRDSARYTDGGISYATSSTI